MLWQSLFSMEKLPSVLLLLSSSTGSFPRLRAAANILVNGWCITSKQLVGRTSRFDRNNVHLSTCRCLSICWHSHISTTCILLRCMPRNRRQVTAHNSPLSACCYIPPAMSPLFLQLSLGSCRHFADVATCGADYRITMRWLTDSGFAESGSRCNDEAFLHF